MSNILYAKEGTAIRDFIKYEVEKRNKSTSAPAVKKDTFALAEWWNLVVKDLAKCRPEVNGTANVTVDELISKKKRSAVINAATKLYDEMIGVD